MILRFLRAIFRIAVATGLSIRGAAHALYGERGDQRFLLEESGYLLKLSRVVVRK
jgi:hypothetical protein